MTLSKKKKKNQMKSKRTGDLAQVVVSLPSKHKAQSSIPNTTKTNKKYNWEHKKEPIE
jgi:hypothetical protein